MGTEGVIIIPESKVKKVRMGARVSSARIKREELVDGQDASAHHAKQKAAIEIETNTKDPQVFGFKG